jgi:hypothetical protein
VKLRGIAIIVILLLLTACGDKTAEFNTDAGNEPVAELPVDAPAKTIAPEEPKWAPEEVQAMALTLAGECYDDKERDKRLVCEVVLNRVSDGSFGDSICDVLTAKNQFAGYWRQSRPVSENDIQVVEQTLKDWFGNDCKALSEYLFYCAGKNRENDFRSTFTD